MANGLQDPVLSPPGGVAVGRGIQNKTASVAGVSDLTDRALRWAALGVYVGASSPGTGITYAAWAAGATGYWGWKQIP